MEKDNSKVVTLFFMCLAGIGWLTTGILFSFTAGQWAPFGRLYSNAATQHGIPVAVGLGLFIILQLRKPSREWADEVVTEIRKVVWPSRKDTTAMTIVCCVMVVVAGLILGLFDFVSSSLVNTVIR